MGAYDAGLASRGVWEGRSLSLPHSEYLYLVIVVGSPSHTHHAMPLPNSCCFMALDFERMMLLGVFGWGGIAWPAVAVKSQVVHFALETHPCAPHDRVIMRASLFASCACICYADLMGAYDAGLASRGVWEGRSLSLRHSLFLNLVLSCRVTITHPPCNAPAKFVLFHGT